MPILQPPYVHTQWRDFLKNQPSTSDGVPTARMDDPYAPNYAYNGNMGHEKKNHLCLLYQLLMGRWLTYPSEKYESQWDGLSHIMENILCNMSIPSGYLT